jgi:hypothetical protein
MPGQFFLCYGAAELSASYFRCYGYLVFADICRLQRFISADGYIGGNTGHVLERWRSDVLEAQSSWSESRIAGI